jgi:hypothetical protein
MVAMTAMTMTMVNFVLVIFSLLLGLMIEFTGLTDRVCPYLHSRQMVLFSADILHPWQIQQWCCALHHSDDWWGSRDGLSLRGAAGPLAGVREKPVL